MYILPDFKEQGSVQRFTLVVIQKSEGFFDDDEALSSWLFWNSPFLQSLAPYELRMPILTHERCNMTYHKNTVYIVGCTDLQRCFFMKRLYTFSEEERRLLKSIITNDD
ncbi:hypothetical protein ANCCAN_16283 [Ancylostoma caninum]|uniref:Uncharacterized protein n=1 Tax=Ancylostoma caninum TaxID=29170 RepID=A0A368G038_ANCCA|nr:hypothetical protein ANCCAN_16283 [Ancylostoma caninum]